jgi:hypothetical protein
MILSCQKLSYLNLNYPKLDYLKLDYLKLDYLNLGFVNPARSAEQYCAAQSCFLVAACPARQSQRHRPD